MPKFSLFSFGLRPGQASFSKIFFDGFDFKKRIIFKKSFQKELTSRSPALTPLSKKEAGNSGIVSGSGAEVISGSFETLLYNWGFSIFCG